MKNKFISFLIYFILTLVSIQSQEPSFTYPLRIESGALYNMIRFNASMNENKESNYYLKNRNANIEGEVKFLNLVSIQIGTGFTRINETKMNVINFYDRTNIGIKISKEFGSLENKFLVGLGIKGYDKIHSKINYYQNDPNLYLINSSLFFGYKFKNFEILTNLSLLSETNSKFKENQNQEFERYYLAGISLSYKISENTRIFAETEYREPYERKITSYYRFWNVYPGVSYNIFNNNQINFSILIPIRGDKNNFDHGFKLGYYFYF
jgi:hypothetical protein